MWSTNQGSHYELFSLSAACSLQNSTPMNEWLQTYVTDDSEVSSAAVQAQKPLAAARIVRLESELSPGKFEDQLLISPHYQFAAPRFWFKTTIRPYAAIALSLGSVFKTAADHG